jgi:hypothetical protein
VRNRSPWSRGDRDGSTEPTDDIREVALRVEAVVALEFSWDVYGLGLLEQDDANRADDAARVVDALPEIIGLTCRT